MHIRNLSVAAILLAALIAAACTQKEDDIKGLAYDPPGATITTDKEIEQYVNLVDNEQYDNSSEKTSCNSIQ